MRFLHISDLHIGKKIGAFSMEEEQRFILDFILDTAEKENIKFILISGDVYDKSVPPAEAVNIFDDFLTKASKAGKIIFVISGNHDSPDRLNFGSRLIKKNNIYISAKFSGQLDKYTVDGVNFYLLPFIKPSYVKKYYPDEPLDNTESAVKFVIDNTEIDENEINILLAHQFVAGESGEIILCDSEESISVGGTDRVNASVFEKFDYTALGHIHSMQTAGRDNVVYCGSPLKYSASEAVRGKFLCIADVDKEHMEITKIPIVPMHDMRVIEGRLSDIMKTAGSDDFVHITLTDKDELINPQGMLRNIFPNMMSLKFSNTYQDINDTISEHRSMSPAELFAKFYNLKTNDEMSEEELKIIEEILDDISDEI